MRFIKRKTDGYLTVEACILVPLTFFLFAFIIHLVFYMHARTVLVQDVYMTAFRASLLPEKEDTLSFIDSNAAWQFGKKYFGNDTPSVTASQSGNVIDASAQTLTHRSAYDLALPELWELKADTRCVHYDMPLHIRRIKRIGDLAETGLQTLKGE